MGKTVHNDVLDAALNYIADNGDRLFVCSSEPSSYEEASSTYKLADKTLTTGDGNGVYTINIGDTSGRKINVAEQANLTVDSAGDATHIVIADSNTQKVLLTTTCTTQSLTTGNTVTVPTFDQEIADPS